MSTAEEIRDVFETDIAEKSRVVLSQTGGILHFLESRGFEIHNLFVGTSLNTDAKELLQRIKDNDSDWLEEADG